MKITVYLVVAAGFLIAAAIVGAVAYANLPAGAVAPIHFGVNGPDRYAPKGIAFSLMPLVGAGVVALLAGLPAIAPKRNALRASAPAWGVTIAATGAVFFVAQAAIAMRTFDPAFDAVKIVFLSIGALFVVVGNVLGKVRHNYVFGVRTPWTLASPRVWDKTHRFTGRLMVLGGLVLILASAVMGAGRPLVWVMAACAAGPALGGVVYSALIYRANAEA